MSAPDISIIVPYHNSVRWLTPALESVAREVSRHRAQAEVILVDSLSTDGSAEVARRFALPAGTAVRHVRAERPGAAAARNSGVREARAEWLAFLDSDDVFGDAHLDARLDRARKSAPRVAIVYSPFQELIADGDAWHPGSVRFPRLTDLPADLLRADNFIQVGSCLMRKAAWQEMDGMDETLPIVHDVNLYVRMAAAGWQFEPCELEPPCLLFRRHPSGSLTTASSRQFALDCERNIDLAAAHYRDRSAALSSAAKMTLMESYFNVAYALARHDRIAFARVASKLRALDSSFCPDAANPPLRYACRWLGQERGLLLAARWWAVKSALRARA